MWSVQRQHRLGIFSSLEKVLSDDADLAGFEQEPHGDVSASIQM